MAMLNSHLEQISLSSAAIAELPFPPPKVFTNALLQPHDITVLIRDTEAHERALFTVSPTDSVKSEATSGTNRKRTALASDGYRESRVTSNGSAMVPRRTTTVATLLGGNMMEQIRRGATSDSRDRGEVDVGLLLDGAEKLCSIYPIYGAMGKIASLRNRYQELSSSISHYEAIVSEQAMQLEEMNRTRDYDDIHEGVDQDVESGPPLDDFGITAEDIEKEEEEIRELEKKKRGLEDRVSGMEKDLGGLLR